MLGAVRHTSGAWSLVAVPVPELGWQQNLQVVFHEGRFPLLVALDLRTRWPRRTAVLVSTIASPGGLTFFENWR